MGVEAQGVRGHADVQRPAVFRRPGVIDVLTGLGCVLGVDGAGAGHRDGSGANDCRARPRDKRGRQDSSDGANGRLQGFGCEVT